MIQSHTAQPNVIFAYWAKEFSSRLALNDVTHVLDVGCRDGRASYALAKMYRHLKITAIDRHKDFIERARQSPEYNHLQDRVQFIHSNYAEMRSQSDFDAVVSFCCLHWLSAEERLASLKSMHDLVKPGGALYLQIFLDHGRQRFDDCIYTVAARDKWQSYFAGMPLDVNKVKLSDTLATMEDLGLLFKSATTQHYTYTFESREAMAAFLAAWCGHLAYLPEGKRKAFLEEAITQHGSLLYRDYVTELVLARPS